MSAGPIFGSLPVPAAGRIEGPEAPRASVIEAGRTPASSFGELFSDGVREVNRQLLASQVDLQRLATGDVRNLHQIMIRLEESRLSFQLLLQVRNRLLEAYQDVMKMQV